LEAAAGMGLETGMRVAKEEVVGCWARPRENALREGRGETFCERLTDDTGDREWEGIRNWSSYRMS
jgi:hypothetical protein